MKTLFLLFTLYCLATASTCNKTMAPDPRLDLVKASGLNDADSYYYSVQEDPAQSAYVLTNPATATLIKADEGPDTLHLQYASVKDKKSNTTKDFRTDLVKKGNTFALVTTDLGSRTTIFEKVFDRDIIRDTIFELPPGGYNSLQECINDFNCKHQSELLCEANRTCKDQFAALTCCLTNGQCFSVHLIIRPTSRRCLILGNLPQLEGIVLSKMTQ